MEDGVGVQLRAVERHHADPQQPRLGAQPQHLDEQSRQRLLVRLAEPADGRMVRRLIGGQYSEGDILATAPLDPPAGALAVAVGLQQQRHQHRGLLAVAPT